MLLADWMSWKTFLVAILDVLLVSYLIYRTLVMVRGTRAQPMLVGLGIIVVVFLVSRELGLVTLSWVLGNFLGSIILIVVVLFQDDLRRALIRVGLGSGYRNADVESVEKSVQEVSKAAAALSARRLGALIVITRDVGLEDYTEEAVPLDALASRQLIESIFLPNSPLHDGAVVIHGDRIVAAGTVLPLTFERSKSATLGTRHRAALGLSERTDALIVVVSEETGTISLVREGRITRELNETSLYNALHRLTVVRQRRRNARRDKRKAKAEKAKKKEEIAVVAVGEDSGDVTQVEG